MLKVRKKVIVVALGGNALIQEGEKGTIQEQFANIQKSIGGIVHCIKKGFEVVITHGNGPQVGNMLLMAELSRGKVPELPLGICVADTEGAIGYMIQQTLVNSLQKECIKKCVVTILTQVIVDKNDPAFKNPTKPIGPFFTEEETKKIINEKGWKMVEDSHRGYRRVVASPKPLKIVEDESVKRLLESGEIVIAAGGGGIPVILSEDGALEGVDVVIDKDLASSVLALNIKANYLMMLTGVDRVYLNYSEPNERPLDTITIEEAERYMAEGHFPPGSMGPKIQAATNFLKGGGEYAFITAIDKVPEPIAGETGTRIIP
ncbi:MAG: carbamate kinase-like carbamoyl phosphatesynthetase [Candidatus Scalindua rubra]|uniref:Carbamate kinase n=1 Tax=Candidatus Scalindua rubra TaxID=1872076 RepID=A0A1E3X7D9_9BACT|nr:MAG: carbamate kinase-like carbamoyl phosphatesynthetase [Candidatus Scalindua rubra]